MNAKFMLWKRAVRVVLFGLLLNVVGMTKGYSNYDFSADVQLDKHCTSELPQNNQRN